MSISKEINHSKVIIVGAGPAGIAAAIQLKRLGIDFRLIDNSYSIGGLLKNANILENIPSYFKGIKAEKYIKKLEKHLNYLNINVTFDNICLVDFYKDKFQLEGNTRDGVNFYTSDYLILATGTKPIIEKNIALPEMSGRVKYEISGIKDKKKKNIVIVGAGDAAFDYALNLSKKNNIILLNRKQETKALGLLVERVKKNKKIQYFENTFIHKVDYKDQTLFITCKNEDSFLLIADYLVFAIGREANFPKFGLNLDLENLKLSKRLYLIGDLVNGKSRQSAISTGDGIKAAMEISLL